MSSQRVTSKPPVKDTVSEFQPMDPREQLLRMIHFWWKHDHDPVTLNLLMEKVGKVLDEENRSVQ